jgi:hypothetical protein
MGNDVVASLLIACSLSFRLWGDIWPQTSPTESRLWGRLTLREVEEVREVVGCKSPGTLAREAIIGGSGVLFVNERRRWWWSLLTLPSRDTIGMGTPAVKCTQKFCIHT